MDTFWEIVSDERTWKLASAVFLFLSVVLEHRRSRYAKYFREIVESIEVVKDVYDNHPDVRMKLRDIFNAQQSDDTTTAIREYKTELKQKKVKEKK